MSSVDEIFQRLEKLFQSGDEKQLILSILTRDSKSNILNHDQKLACQYNSIKLYLENTINEIDMLANEIRNGDILISVRNQKLLRTCYQIVSSFGISICLVPGLGINLSKRCISACLLQQIVLSDEQKYEFLTICTDFLNRSYDIPVLKNIIITFHLSDYLAALIQLAFAPIKKPGTYPKFTMTKEMYTRITYERQKYIGIYEYLVHNCFQPILMKELLVLQSVTHPQPPLFVKRTIAKEMSRRLTAPGGLLSLIRCFIESNELDTGVEWKKIDMICKIVSTKHGNSTEDEYLRNIVSQLKQIMQLNNSHYLATAISCLLNLLEKFPKSEHVVNLSTEMFKLFDYENLLLKATLPGTIILSPQEVDHNIKIFHACSSIIKVDTPPPYSLSPNLYILFLLNMKSTKMETKSKIRDIIIKSLEILDQIELKKVITTFLFGWKHSKLVDVSIEEYESGLAIKCSPTYIEYQFDAAAMLFLDIFEFTTNNTLLRNLFDSCLQIFIELCHMRHKILDKKLLQVETNLLSENDEKYAQMLQILAEISSSQKVINIMKSNPLIVVSFVENLFLIENNNSNDECKTIALVLLNTVLSNTPKTKDLEPKLHGFLPILQKISECSTEYIGILCKETMSLIISEFPKKKESAYEKGLSDVYSNLLPVRAHGILELTKLIDKGDPETLSKRHFVFCLFQEQLKDSDSYIYLEAINGLASLATQCTHDVLSVLCKEYLEISSEISQIETQDIQNKRAELKMKIGDSIVKVTKRLGEMAVVHKNILLNTMLCATRDDDPLIRASALSNLAEIALVLHYKVGTIIYELLLCIWSIIESDEAIECRRAAVMVIASLLKGLGQDTLVELKDNILPIYRTLSRLYRDPNEDSVLKLHAQIALEELDDIVKQFLSLQQPMEKKIIMFNDSKDIIFK